MDKIQFESIHLHSTPQFVGAVIVEQYDQELAICRVPKSQPKAKPAPPSFSLSSPLVPCIVPQQASRNEYEYILPRGPIEHYERPEHSFREMVEAKTGWVVNEMTCHLPVARRQMVKKKPTIEILDEIVETFNDPLTVQLRTISEDETELIWWFLTDCYDTSKTGEFYTIFLPFKEAIDMLTHEADRVVARKAIETLDKAQFKKADEMDDDLQLEDLEEGEF